MGPAATTQTVEAKMPTAATIRAKMPQFLSPPVRPRATPELAALGCAVAH